MSEYNKNLACLIEYDGSNFYGFQKQLKNPTWRTIQTELETALAKFACEPINIITAGRTDTGVHAFAQVINFKTSQDRPMYNWIRGTNSLLPNDIVIHQCLEVEQDFSARFNAISRTYHYYLLNAPTRPAILNKKIGWTHPLLDLTLMSKACTYLLGQHDFSSFRASLCQANNPIKIMTKSEVTQITKNILCFKFTANSFLYHMIRNIVGALIYVGQGRLSIDEFISIIAVRDRKCAPPTFMPDGLYLAEIEYPEHVLKFNKQNNYLIF